jgi:hypothetical protein
VCFVAKILPQYETTISSNIFIISNMKTRGVISFTCCHYLLIIKVVDSTTGRVTIVTCHVTVLHSNQGKRILFRWTCTHCTLCRFRHRIRRIRATILKKRISEISFSTVTSTAISTDFPALCTCSIAHIQHGTEQCERDWTAFTISDNK